MSSVFVSYLTVFITTAQDGTGWRKMVYVPIHPE